MAFQRVRATDVGRAEQRKIGFATHVFTNMGTLTRTVALVAASIGVMAFAGAADAATIGYGQGAHTPLYLTFKASPGEVNHLQVTSGPAPLTGAPSITFRDPGNLILPDR